MECSPFLLLEEGYKGIGIPCEKRDARGLVVQSVEKPPFRKRSGGSADPLARFPNLGIALEYPGAEIAHAETRHAVHPRRFEDGY